MSTEQNHNVTDRITEITPRHFLYVRVTDYEIVMMIELQQQQRRLHNSNDSSAHRIDPRLGAWSRVST